MVLIPILKCTALILTSVFIYISIFIDLSSFIRCNWKIKRCILSINLKCIHCKMIINFNHTTSHSYFFFFFPVKRTHKIYSFQFTIVQSLGSIRLFVTPWTAPCKFQIYSTIVLTMSLCCVYYFLQTYSSYNWKSVSFDQHLPTSLAPDPWTTAMLFSGSVSIILFSRIYI